MDTLHSLQKMLWQHFSIPDILDIDSLLFLIISIDELDVLPDKHIPIHKLIVF